jgi:uncharacterized protein
MRIFLSGLSDEPKNLSFDQTAPWFAQALSAVSEGPLDAASAQNLSVTVYKSEGLVILKGHYQGSLNLLCSRCAVDFKAKLNTDFQCLFTPDRGLIENDQSQARSLPTPDDDGDLDLEFLDKEYIELGDVVQEQLYLKVPFQPLCQADCKGLCATCGQNQNTEPCQCHRLKMGPLAKGITNLLQAKNNGLDR